MCVSMYICVCVCVCVCMCSCVFILYRDKYYYSIYNIYIRNNLLIYMVNLYFKNKYINKNKTYVM